MIPINDILYFFHIAVLVHDKRVNIVNMSGNVDQNKEHNNLV